MMAGIVIFISSWAIDTLFGGISAFRIFLAATLLLFIWNGLLKDRVGKPNPGEIGLVLFAIWAMLSYFWSLKPELTAAIIEYVYVAAVAMFIVTKRISANVKFWRFLGYAYILGCVVASILVINNAATFAAQGERVGVGELNPNYIAYSLVTSIPVSLALLTTKRHRLWFKSALVGGMAMTMFATMITGSRGALLAALLCILSFFVVRATRNFLKSMLWIALSGIGLTVFWEYLPGEIRERLDVFAMIFSGDASSVDLSGRADIWPLAMQYFEDNLLAGIGAGAFKGVNPFGIEGHNVFPTVATETGIIGLLIYALTIFYIFFELIFQSKTREIRNAGIAMLAVWVPIAMTGVWEGSVVAWLVFGWLLAASQHEADPLLATTKQRRRIRFAF